MQRLPLVYLDGEDLFSGMVIPVTVITSVSRAAIDDAQANNCPIAVTTIKTPEIILEAKVVQVLRRKDYSYRALIETSGRRVRGKTDSEGGHEWVEVSKIKYTRVEKNKIEALRRRLIETMKTFCMYIEDNKLLAEISDLDDPEAICDYLIVNIEIAPEFKSELAGIPTLIERMRTLIFHVEDEIAIKKEEVSIYTKVQNRILQMNKEAYLREQLKVIQAELGCTDEDSSTEEIRKYEKQLSKARMPKEVSARVKAELKRFRMMGAFSSEASVTRSWLDCILSLPWGKKSALTRDLTLAKSILDRDHFGLDEVKERILEFLAVQSRTEKQKGQVICLVGPPGIGKTSLAKSMAEATGREFVRISLGGVHDEAEIRGHRRTYVSAFCGRIISAIKKAGTSNPLILLDEIDKVASDMRGDPEAVLLEVLDPEQNKAFSDHYLEVDYDLSDVMFVATANTLSMTRPLLDRMEIIRLSAYTEQEKFEIAKKYLISKKMQETGLNPDELRISDKALTLIIQDYTREAGVRSLEREIAKIARKVLKEISEGTCNSVDVTPKNLEKYLGVPKYTRDEIESKNLVGVTNGLAWTGVGGEILSIESVMYPGKGKITFTGKLGDVMQESIQAAMSFVRSKSKEYNLDSDIFEKHDFHVHVPEGATPKDGPSAGVAMVTSIMSSATGIPVRNDVAMTGEITLRGRILPIGGLKEKILAGHRSKVKTIIIPEENKKDLKEIPASILKQIDIKLLENVDDVLKIALAR